MQRIFEAISPVEGVSGACVVRQGQIEASSLPAFYGPEMVEEAGMLLAQAWQLARRHPPRLAGLSLGYADGKVEVFEAGEQTLLLVICARDTPRRALKAVLQDRLTAGSTEGGPGWRAPEKGLREPTDVQTALESGAVEAASVPLSQAGGMEEGTTAGALSAAAATKRVVQENPASPPSEISTTPGSAVRPSSPTPEVPALLRTITGSGPSAEALRVLGLPGGGQPGELKRGVTRISSLTLSREQRLPYQEVLAEVAGPIAPLLVQEALLKARDRASFVKALLEPLEEEMHSSDIENRLKELPFPGIEP